MNIHKRFRTIYSECAEILKKIVNKKTTLKNEIYKNKKPASYIPIIEKVLQNYDLLNKIIQETNFLKKDVFYSLILCNEVLIGKINNKFWLSNFEKIKKDAELVHFIKEKYIRLNKTNGTEKDLKELKLEKTFIPDVYKLIENVDFSKIKAYKNGKIVIQNIASCIPGFILNPELNSTIIDTCAAPGNKTSHVSDLLKNTGKVFAFEVDEKRFKILNYQIKKLNLKNVTSLNEDFLDVENTKYKNVDYMLVDPTCSGSGIHEIYEKDEERIKNLQKFQIKILKHAMTFGAKKIVYSTCSLHKEEGEDVVLEAIKESEYEIFDLQSFFTGNTFEGLEVVDKFVRCTSKDNKETIGFFAALLIKK
ncbi:NOL1/NOP2/SUN domain-family member 5 [Vairimorpha necatrix]|uniref:NOL1/NOP2/SUN domain-family member 5 n=1 Tax=Vairimorpha necatrix TaxID=6039 RepID=A0AAX4JDQ5_9MICR